MYEIVLFKATQYVADQHIGSWVLDLQWPYALWWFSEPDTKMGLDHAARWTDEHGFMMNCDAIHFAMAFVPNPEHFGGRSYLADDYEGAGVDPFEEFLPQLVEIAKRRLETVQSYADLGFYGLFNLDLQVFGYGDDGDSAEVHTNPKWVGELDITKLPLALMGQGVQS